jgi:hypothetical protein
MWNAHDFRLRAVKRWSEGGPSPEERSLLTFPMVAPIAPTAVAAGGEIGGHNPVANLEPGNGAADGNHLANEFVTDDCSRLNASEIASDHMQISTANASQVNADKSISRPL